MRIRPVHLLLVAAVIGIEAATDETYLDSMEFYESTCYFCYGLLVMRLGLTAVYYLAPSIVGVVIVVVLSSMWKTEARCFFMVTVPFYF